MTSMTKPRIPTIEEGRARLWKDAISADARRIIGKSRNITLYVLDPRSEGFSGKGEFHSFKVLGTARIGAESRRAMLRSFYDGVTKETVSAMCHFPRHALRFSDGRKNLDVTVCFKCANIHVFEGASEISGWPSFDTGTSQKSFDKIFEQAGLKIDYNSPSH